MDQKRIDEIKTRVEGIAALGLGKLRDFEDMAFLLDELNEALDRITPLENEINSLEYQLEKRRGISSNRTPPGF